MEKLIENGTPRGTEEYWESYYKNSNDKIVKEWYCNFNIMKNFLPELKFEKILILGNGVSSLFMDILKDKEFKNSLVTSVDISQSSCIFIENLAKEKLKESQRKRLRIECLDVTKMTYNSEFNLILDKGFIDSFWKSSNQIDFENMKIIESKVHNSLEKEGIWLIFSLYDLSDIGFLDQKSSSLWESISDAEFTFQEKEIRVYKLKK